MATEAATAPEFDMNQPECTHLFQAVTAVLRRYVGGKYYFNTRYRIATDVFEQILTAGEAETGRRPTAGE